MVGIPNVHLSHSEGISPHSIPPQKCTETREECPPREFWGSRIDRCVDIRFGSKADGGAARRERTLNPQERTHLASARMPAKCHSQTSPSSVTEVLAQTWYRIDNLFR